MPISGTRELGGLERVPGGWTYRSMPARDLWPGFTPETIKPVVAIVSPAVGSQINTNTPLVVDVTDNLLLFRRIVLVVTVGSVRETVHDGDGFSSGYSAGSTRVSIANGFRYTIVRTAGWPAGTTVEFEAFAIDTAGNEAD